MPPTLLPSPSIVFAEPTGAGHGFIPNFGERYAARHNLSSDNVDRVVLRRCLYPHIRLLRPLVALFSPRFFTPELELIAIIARQSRRRDAELEVEEYRCQFAEAGVLRRHLRLRISTRRLSRLLAETFSEPPPVSPTSAT